MGVEGAFLPSYQAPASLCVSASGWRSQSHSAVCLTLTPWLEDTLSHGFVNFYPA